MAEKSKLPGNTFKIFLTVLVCLIIVLMAAGPTPPLPTLQWPLSSYIGLSSSFGEFRNNHFHAGIDFKTGGQTGLEVRAVESGTIYRLNVQKRGYGKALYIKHANGLVSVYAHLLRFEENYLHLESHVAQAQLEKRKYPGNIFLSVPVTKNQLIAWSGETGAGLPHLHFELRQGEDKPINPLPYLTPAFKDTTVPTFKSVSLKPISAGSFVNFSPETLVLTTSQLAGMTEQKLPVVTGSIEFAVDVHDTIGAANKVGIYQLDLCRDDVLIKRIRFDAMTYSNNHRNGLLYDLIASGYSPTRYIHKFGHGSVPGTPFLSASPTTTVSLDTQTLHQEKVLLKFVASDYAGNHATLKLPLRIRTDLSSFRDRISGPGQTEIPVLKSVSVKDFGSFHVFEAERTHTDQFAPLILCSDAERHALIKVPLYEFGPGRIMGIIDLSAYQTGPVQIKVVDPLDPNRVLFEHNRMFYHFQPGRTARFKDDDLVLYIPEAALYDHLYLGFERFEAKAQGQLVPFGQAVSFTPAGTPFDRTATLTFLVPDTGSSDLTKLGIYQYYENGHYWSYQYSSQRPGPNAMVLEAQIRYLSTFALFLDLVPPTIQAQAGFKPASVKRGALIRLTVRDEGTGIDDEHMEISLDDQALEAEYDPDRHWLEIQIPLGTALGRHVLKVQLTDRVGNRSETFQTVMTVV
ncbi:M23 family metallopeptidase [bacterium]|nr:M23 family metallopeptidase [bacterium]